MLHTYVVGNAITNLVVPAQLGHTVLEVPARLCCPGRGASWQVQIVCTVLARTIVLGFLAVPARLTEA